MKYTIYKEKNRRRMSIARKGKKLSKEVKDKISQSAKGNSYGKGHKQTKEHIEKLRKARRKPVFDTLMIGVNYDEFKPETYKGVFVFSDEVIKLYNTGDFRKDFRNARVFANRRGKKVIYSSTVDHFITDRNEAIHKESECL